MIRLTCLFELCEFVVEHYLERLRTFMDIEGTSPSSTKVLASFSHLQGSFTMKMTRDLCPRSIAISTTSSQRIFELHSGDTLVSLSTRISIHSRRVGDPHWGLGFWVCPGRCMSLNASVFHVTNLMLTQQSIHGGVIVFVHLCLAICCGRWKQVLSNQ